MRTPHSATLILGNLHLENSTEIVFISGCQRVIEQPVKPLNRELPSLPGSGFWVLGLGFRVPGSAKRRTNRRFKRKEKESGQTQYLFYRAAEFHFWCPMQKNHALAFCWDSISLFAIHINTLVIKHFTGFVSLMFSYVKPKTKKKPTKCQQQPKRLTILSTIHVVHRRTKQEYCLLSRQAGFRPL